MVKKRETVGKSVSELLHKTPDSLDPIEVQRTIHKDEDYIQQLIEVTNNTKKVTKGDFYIEVITKREPIMKIVFRSYFKTRYTCPTPQYDQSVFKYDSKKDEIEYIWTLPDRDTCRFMKENALVLPKDQHELLKFVLMDSDGSLLGYCKHLNNETDKTPQLILGA